MSKEKTEGADYADYGAGMMKIGNAVLTRGQMLQQILAALDTKDKEEKGSDYQDNPNPQEPKFNPITGNMSDEKRTDASETFNFFLFE